MISVSVPATTANCMVGFDCLGMALDWSATYRFWPSDHLEIIGCDEAYANESHMVVQAFYYACQQMKKEKPIFRLVCESDIPFERGLGSSAIMIVAGLMAAVAWHQQEVNKMVLYQWACQLEGHGDNVGPAIFGQATISYPKEDGFGMMMVPLANWYGLAVMSDIQVNTHQARQVLPKELSFEKSSRQVAHALAFVQALSSQNKMALSDNMIDYLHEPYRRHLIPYYDQVKRVASSHHCVMWISGSGSTLLLLSDQTKDLLEASYELEKQLGVSTRLVKPAKRGAFVSYE